jgi:outer membrane protein OmpA-like peptidoglycan-associated protein
LENEGKFSTGAILFAFNSSEIDPESYDVLDQIVKIFKLNNSWTIEVAGHTDNVGDDSYNQKLSLRRAISVRKYLTQKGIDGNRLIAIGYGETEPIASNDTKEGRAQNRRVEFKIVE